MKILIYFILSASPLALANDSEIQKMFSLLQLNEAKFSEVYQGKNFRNEGNVIDIKQEQLLVILGLPKISLVRILVNGSIVSCVTQDNKKAASLLPGDLAKFEGKINEVSFGFGGSLELSLQNCKLRDPLK